MKKLISLSIVLVCAFALSAQATTVVGGSVLLGSSEAQQIEVWLGEGPISLTNLFAKTAGDGKTSLDFHAAVDGMGRTVSVIEVLPTQGNAHEVIGGYNPHSWYSGSGYYFSEDDADRNAFLFNLTTVTILRQWLGQPRGRYQTINQAEYGPTFGAGADLYVASNLSTGSMNSFSYGDDASHNQGYHTFDIGTIEIFRVDTVIPEPLTCTLFGGSVLLGLGRLRRRLS